MCTLNLATVTAKGEPRISAVDGHFLHARWVFTTSGTAAKARQLRARPAASISYVDGERIGVFSHGQVEFLTPEHPDFDEIEEHLVEALRQLTIELGPRHRLLPPPAALDGRLRASTRPKRSKTKTKRQGLGPGRTAAARWRPTPLLAYHLADRADSPSVSAPLGLVPAAR